MTIPEVPKRAWDEARRMYESGSFTMPQIIRKTGLSKTAIYGKAARDGWKRQPGVTPTFNSANVERSIAARASAPVYRLEKAPVSGSQPVPFHEVPRGCCVYILGDMPGAMDMAPTCALPGYPYCETHADLVNPPPANGKSPTAKELARSLRRVLGL